jgi:hypothetical protein
MESRDLGIQGADEIVIFGLERLGGIAARGECAIQERGHVVEPCLHGSGSLLRRGGHGIHDLVYGRLRWIRADRSLTDHGAQGRKRRR